MTSTILAPTSTVVVTDTNVLINFIHIQQFPLLNRLGDHRFTVPEHVVEEITWDSQVVALAQAFDDGHLERCAFGDKKTARLYSLLLHEIESGEAACIAIAFARGQCVATDERRDARRIAIDLLGEDRLLGTESILLKCIEAKLITVAEADAFKATLATKRYIMNFASFADLEPA